MTVFRDDTFLPYEFNSRWYVLNYVIEQCAGIKHSLRLVDMTNEHLEVRCPLTGDYLDITGTEQELYWLHSELSKRGWYKII